MINYKTINKNENVMVCYSEFTPPKGVTEYQVMIQLTKPGQSYEEQLKLLLDTYSDLKENEFKKGTTIFKRYFLSDAANQTDLLLKKKTKAQRKKIPIPSSIATILKLVFIMS